MPIVYNQPGVPVANNAIDDARTTPEIERQTAMQAYYAEQERRMAEQAAAAEAERQRLAAQVPVTQPGAPAPAAAAPAAPAAPVAGRGDGFVDPRLQPQGQVAPTTTGPEPGTFPAWLQTQEMYPNVRTLEDFKKAPPRIKQEMVDAGLSDRLQDKSITRENARLLKTEAYRNYINVDQGKPEKESSGLLGGAADIGLEVVAGLGQGVKSISDLINPRGGMSTYMQGQLAEIASAKSPNAQRDTAWLDARLKEATARGATAEAFKAWLTDGVGNSPAETMANLAASFAPMLASGGVKAVQGALGFAQGAGGVRGQIYDTALQAARGKAPLASGENAADDRLTRMGTENLAADAANPLKSMTTAGHMLLGGVLGAVESLTGVQSMLKPSLGIKALTQTSELASGITARLAEKAAAVASKVPAGALAVRVLGSKPAGAVGRATVAGAEEAVPEFLQGYQQQYAGNSGAADAGLRDPSQNSEGAVLSGLQGAALGFGAGVGLHPAFGRGAPAPRAPLPSVPPTAGGQGELFPGSPGGPGQVPPAEAAAGPQPQPGQMNLFPTNDAPGPTSGVQGSLFPAETSSTATPNQPAAATVHTAETWGALTTGDRKAYTAQMKGELAQAKTLAEAEAVNLDRQGATSTSPRPELAAYEALKLQSESTAKLAKKQASDDAKAERLGRKEAERLMKEEAVAIAKDGTGATAPRPYKAAYDRLLSDQAAARKGAANAAAVASPQPTAKEIKAQVEAEHDLPKSVADMLWSEKVPGKRDPVDAVHILSEIVDDEKATRDIAAWLHSVMPEGTMVELGSVKNSKGQLAHGKFTPEKGGRVGADGTVSAGAPATITLDLNKGINRQTIMHEATHAVTAGVLRGVEADMAANAAMPGVPPANQHTPDQHAAYGAISELWSRLGTRTAAPSPIDVQSRFPNAFKDVHEFVSEALSDHEFQAYLKTQDAGAPTGDVSVWDRFKTTIRSLLRMPVSKVPNSAFEALLDATSTLVPGRRDILNAGGGDPDYDQDALFRLATDPAKTPAQRKKALAKVARQKLKEQHNEDFVFARAASDAKGSVRGTAVWNKETLTYDLTWHNMDGQLITETTPDVDDAKAWLRDQEGGTGHVEAVQQKSQAADAEQSLRLREATNVLDTIVPGVADLSKKLNDLIDKSPLARAYISEDAVYNVARTLSGMHQTFGNKAQAQDKVLAMVEKYHADMAADPTKYTDGQRDLVARLRQMVGSDASMRANAAAIAQRTNAGFGTDAEGKPIKSWADHRNGVRDTRKALVKAGLPAHVASDIAYAYSAAQRNANNTKRSPYDAQGNKRGGADGDIARFSYTTDAGGNIVADGTPGGTVVTGADAPSKYKDAVMKQFPQHAEGIKALIDGIGAGNKHVLDFMHVNGALTTGDYHALLDNDLYLPMQQTDKRASARIKGALGRTSKAKDPMAQWMAVSDARIDAAARAGIIQQIGRAVLAMPMPNLARVNPSSIEVKPHTAKQFLEAESVADILKLQKVDWTGEDSVTFRIGHETFQLQLVDKQLRDSLKPGGPEAGSGHELALNSARRMTSALAFMKVGLNPGFLATQVFWDPIVAIWNMQGAWTSGTGGSKVGNVEALQLSAKFAGKLMSSAFNGGLRDSFGRQFSAGRSSTDPVRALYDARGGGIHMDAKLELPGSENSFKSMLDLVHERKLGAVAGRGLHNFKHGVEGIGHTWSDTVRFEAFKAYLEHQHGGAFASAQAMAAYANANPEVINTAVTGSKNIIANFERMGESSWSRAVLPFFNAGMTGTTQVLPQILSSKYGWSMMMGMTGLATLAAMAALADPDDVDADGESKYLSKPGSLKSIKIGGFTLPVPPELQMALVGGLAFAALASDRELNHADIHGKLWNAIVGLSPARVPDFQNAGLAQAAGLIGIPFMLTGGQDGLGNSVLPTGRVLPGTPEHLQPRNQDSQTAIDAADALAVLGADVAPGSITNFMQQFTGASYGIANAAVQGNVDGRGSLMAMVDQMTKNFVYETPSSAQQESFALRERKAEVNREVLESGDAAAIAKLAPAELAVNSIKSSSGLTQAKLAMAMAKARREGDESTYQAMMAEREDLSMRQDKVRGAQINMLRPL
ncbi:MAG: hypothetical protein RL260_3110 [Pseudomonadota bacterium]